MRPRITFTFLFLLLWIPGVKRDLQAQVRPVYDQGALGLGQLLRKLRTTGSVMMIGAHPDDEDSALLAYLARGENARTAYLSLTRGDGGQNIIGPELFEPLGVIRSEELLQARRLDGAEQYFTRAFDYGFSKTLAEARSKWDEQVITCDAVRAVRRFRPLVVISRFSGTPSDGHGQHQYAGYISPKVVTAAGDPRQCLGAGIPWWVKKFYVESGFNDQTEPTLRINTGAPDPILGRTYFEIAMEGRSLHRSQGEGRIQFHGDQFSGLNLVGAAKETREKSIFEGLNVSVSGIAQLAENREEPFAPKIATLASKIEEVTSIPNLMQPRSMIPLLAEIYKLAYDAEWSTRQPESKFRLQEVQRKAAAALRIAGNIEIDPLSDVETVVPGDDLLVSVKIFGIKDGIVDIGDISLTAPAGWDVTKADPPRQNNAAFNGREVALAGAAFNVKVAPTAKITQPYWLQDGRDGDLFSWPQTDARTLPFDPPELTAQVKLSVNGITIPLAQSVQYRFADPARGEVRREVNAVPAVSVNVDRDLLVVPVSDRPQVRRLVMSVTNNAAREVSGNASLNIAVSPDWTVTATQGSAFSLKTRGAKASIPFDIAIPAGMKAGSIPIRAGVRMGAADSNITMNVVAYPHIQTHRYYTRADTIVQILDLNAAPVNVGYIMGSGDEVPEAISQMGMSVTMLGEEDLSSAVLSKFDTIVVGIRASETRPDFVANNGRLLDYVRNGGNLIVQYQRGNWTSLAPFPIDTADKQRTAAGSIARVVDENAKVTILDPQNPVFNSPNKITDADFVGWVQERNAYNLVTFDPQYIPLLESHDAGEQENKGGLVIAKVGKGNWVYCSYSFFRQLPAGVPGAYRLLANLLSVPRAAK